MSAQTALTGARLTRDHLAIMKKEWGLTPKILSGEKTIESRWAKNRPPYWGKVKEGDTIYFKDSGEPVTVKAVISNVVWRTAAGIEDVRARVIMMGSEDEGYTFYETGKKEGDGCFYVSGIGISFQKRVNKEGDIDSNTIDAETMLERVKDKELTASIFLGWSNGEEAHKLYTEWEQFAKVIGVSKMVAISVKVPENVARRFKVFAEESSTTADVLRNLICKWVINEMKENADSLIFKDAV